MEGKKILPSLISVYVLFILIGWGKTKTEHMRPPVNLKLKQDPGKIAGKSRTHDNEIFFSEVPSGQFTVLFDFRLRGLVKVSHGP